MRALLIGGGKVGSYLARELDKAGHVVSVIEANLERAEALAESGRVLVFRGDGTDVGLLKSANVDRADWVLAVTGRDEANLVSCQIATTLGAQHVLARLNDPRNRPTFDALDVPVVAVTDLMVQIISQQVEVGDLQRIALVAGGKVSLIERTLGAGFAPTALNDLALPQPALVVAVVRDGDVSVPTGTTVVQSGDRLLAVTTVQNEAVLCDALDAASIDGGP
jgi:trk system potassium uptake protein TrkA